MLVIDISGIKFLSKYTKYRRGVLGSSPKGDSEIRIYFDCPHSSLHYLLIGTENTEKEWRENYWRKKK